MSLHDIPVGQNIPEDLNVLEKNKWVKVYGWEDIDAARKEVIDAVQRFNDLPDKPNF